MLVLSAGMPRSASTWLYNVLRLSLTNTQGCNWECGWIDDLDTPQEKRPALIKLHTENKGLADAADLIFYSFRDIRDALASMKRKFGHTPTLALASHLIEADTFWKQRASFVMKYELMIESPIQTVESILNFLCIEGVNPNSLLSELNSIDFESCPSENALYNKVNLYHKGHITNGGVGVWNEDLDKGFVTELESEFRWWFKENGFING